MSSANAAFGTESFRTGLKAGNSVTMSAIKFTMLDVIGRPFFRSSTMAASAYGKTGRQDKANTDASWPVQSCSSGGERGLALIHVEGNKEKKNPTSRKIARMKTDPLSLSFFPFADNGISCYEILNSHIRCRKGTDVDIMPRTKP